MIHAYIFDVFGTLVDWRTGVANEARAVFATVRRVRPEAVRKESREWFLVGTARR